jgi:4-amino-4-deoxy-L-arabinose transferase-like glycosyltransferase
MSHTVPPPAGAVRRGLSWWSVVLLAGLVLLAVLRSHAGTRLDSFTIDEPWHIVAGASYVETGDWRLNPEHPPLTKLWVGAFMPGLLVLPPFAPLADKMQERDFVEKAVYFGNDARAVQQRARLAMWALNGALLLLAGALVWHVFGGIAAVALLALCALEPTLSAHMPLVMTDLPLGLALFAAAVCAGLLATDWRWRHALLAGFAMGLALGTKHSALAGLAAIGIALCCVLAWQSRRVGARASVRRAGLLVVAALVAFAVLWAQYGFRFHTSPDGGDPFNRATSDKIADLQKPVLRAVLTIADDNRLLPRPYLWGLADTLRAGVDGRGQAEYRVWGRLYRDTPPWHIWPSQIVSKLPLATLLMALLSLGVVLRMRRQLTPRERMCLWMVWAMAGGHFVALALSQGSYAGIRHALPLVFALLLLVALALRGAIEALRQRPAAARARALVATYAALAALLLAATLPEPRLYEFHNSLAGGTAGAWRNFANESLHLDQRFHELRAYHDAVIVPSGLPVYGGFSRQSEAAGLRNRNYVVSLDDENVGGVYEGYFVVPMSAWNPAPHWDWDPQAFYADTEEVHRMGFLQIRKGRVSDPRTRARGIGARLLEYVHRDNGKDAALVALRGAEVLAVEPRYLPLYIDVGNAHLALRHRDEALAAYRGLRAVKDVPIDPDILASVDRHIARIEASDSLDGIAPMRSPFME